MIYLREFLQMVKPEEKPKPRYDFRSKVIKEKVRKVNQETDGLERQEADCFAGLLCGNGEDDENETF